MIHCTRRSDGITLPVHVTPGAKQNRVGDQHDGALRVSVTAAPDKGRANRAVLKELAKALHLRPAQLSVVSGETNRRKLVAIESEDAESLLARIAALVANGPGTDA